MSVINPFNVTLGTLRALLHMQHVRCITELLQTVVALYERDKMLIQLA